MINDPSITVSTLPAEARQDPYALAQHLTALITQGHDPRDPEVIRPTLEAALHFGGDIEDIVLALVQDMPGTSGMGILAACLEHTAINAVHEGQAEIEERLIDHADLLEAKLTHMRIERHEQQPEPPRTIRIVRETPDDS